MYHHCAEVYDGLDGCKANDVVPGCYGVDLDGTHPDGFTGFDQGGENGEVSPYHIVFNLLHNCLTLDSAHQITMLL